MPDIEVALGSTLAGLRVERLLGRGGMGAVYLAEDVHLRRKVAMKVLAPELAGDERFRRRFLLESQLAASLEHPHIVPIYAAGEEGGVLFLAMRYVEGYDLRALIDTKEPVGTERTLSILAQVGDALDAAHGLGLVHRDVKPANIMIAAGEHPHAYLCDFGLARHASSVGSLTGQGFVGTIDYVAPEQIEGDGVDARTDVYSLGCVLYECLTGAPPFERDGDLRVVFAHLKEPPPLVTRLRPDLPDAIDAVVAQALAKAPDDRFSTCSELVAAASEALALDQPPVAPATRRTVPGVRTFLITDIRGYTSYTVEKGDEAAAELASAFAGIVRSVVEEREGRLIELRGDEALVVFDSARQALRSAVELQSRVDAAKLPRRIGIGLDAGEAVPVEDGYRGGALNLAARLCSVAAPGEVLASETVLQLARAVEGIRYGERRQERMKGFARPVTAVEVLPADRRVARFDPKRMRRSVRRGLRRKPVRIALAAAVVAAVVAVVAVLALGGSAKKPFIAAQSVGFVTPAGAVAGQLPVSGDGDLGVLGGTLWFANGDDKVLEPIDLRTRQLKHPFVSIQDGIAGMAVGLGAIWVVDGTEPLLLRIDPRYRTIERIPLPAKKADIDFTAPTEAAVGAGSVWVAEADKVFRIDPTTRKVVKTISVPDADLLAFGDGSLWVGQSNSSSVSEIDPALNQVVKTVHLRDWVSDIAVGGGFVWATVIPDDTLWKIDENGTVDKTIDVAHGPGPVTYFNGTAWVGTIEGLQQVDARSGEVVTYPIVNRVVTLAGGKDVLYLSAGAAPPKLSPLPDDQVATFSLAEDWLDDTDPAHGFPSTTFRAQFGYATGAQLLNYPDASGPRGATLQPEVAAAMPTISDGGRTYTFRIRPGYRFSPPSNAPVTAETFRFSIERALSKGLGQEAPGYGFVSDIVGAGAFHAGRAEHISGISVSGDTLRIRLVAPAGDFPARLSTPFFAAVPLGTPVVRGGVQTPIPSAGPYYLKLLWGNQGDLIVLERNPNYRGPRPHRLARIVYDTNDNTRRSVQRIETQDADYTADALSVSTFAPGGPLEQRYGRAKFGATRLVQTPQNGIRYLRFNTDRGPFRSARLRRAVSAAIDRRALAGVQGGRPTSSYLPAAFPSAAGTEIAPLAPDLARARRLARGFHGTVTVVACDDQTCATTARILRANLAALGIKVRIKGVSEPFGEEFKPDASYDILLTGWAWDWIDPSEVLDDFFSTKGFRLAFLPPPITIPASYRREVESTSPLTGQARVDAYHRLAIRLERDVAPLAVYSTWSTPELFSARVTCGVEQPVIASVDLGTLCVRHH